MSTLETGGYFNRDSEVEKFIASYNDFYEGKEEIKGKIIYVLSEIKKLGLKDDSIWYRKSNFFTLVVEICRVSKPDFVSIKAKISTLEDKVLGSKYIPKGENDFSTYYAYMYTGTNSRQARVMRSQIFQKYVLGYEDNAIKKSSNM
jgi:hypothetical protein